MLADPASFDALLDVPALVLDLRADAAAPAEAGRLRHAPCPVFAVVADDEADAWPVDLVLAEGAGDTLLLGGTAAEAAEALAAAAAVHPGAAATLARVLRVTTDADVP